ncbi:MAG: hypothetical protein PHI85_06600 [Victivallaceae bacterium]|nr:hypothetical protein [Victivallaceae bacterium]
MFRFKLPIRRKKAVLLWCGGAAVLVLLLLLFLIFSRPRTFAPPPLSVNDTLTQMTLAAQLYRQISDSRDPAVSVEITLEPEQVNALLNMILNIAALNEHVAELPFTAAYDGKNIVFSASCSTGMSWLFGGAVVFSGAALVECGSYGDEHMTVDALRMGWLPLPGALGGAAFDLAMDRVRRRMEYRRFRPALVSVSRTDDGALNIVYYPYFFRDYVPDIREQMRKAWR